jgi:uncharacterized protein (DUF305 family)
MHSVMSPVGPLNDSDTDFVKLMLSYHQGVVDMAKAELIYGKDSQMRRLAQEIVELWLKHGAVGS